MSDLPLSSTSPSPSEANGPATPEPISSPSSTQAPVVNEAVKTTPPEELPTTPLLPPTEPGEEVGVTQVEAPQLTLGERIKQSTAFALSAVLSPYLVLPIGTAGIIGSITQPRNTFVLYTLVSVFFSTILPALYVVFEVWRGRITDVHIMDRAQRGGPFLVAILSSAVGAAVLRGMGAPSDVWGISAVLAFNGALLTVITSYWKISMHVAVLSATVTAALFMIPQDTPWPLLALIPALMWGRVTRGRHTIWQGVAGALVAAVITGAGCLGLRYLYSRPAFVAPRATSTKARPTPTAPQLRSTPRPQTAP